MRPLSPSPETSAADGVSCASTFQVVESLRHLESVWQGRKSRLTPTGAPYEHVFTSYDPVPRFTFEVAGPDTPFSERLDAAVSRLDVADAATVERLATLAYRAESPHVPVWLGARGAGLQQFKLYVSVADVGAGHAWVEEFIGPGSLISSCAHQLKMIGYAPDDGQLEFYYLLKGFEEWHIPLLMRRCGQGTNAQPLSETLLALVQRPLDKYLPSKMGFSVSVNPASTSIMVALHCLASILVGRDVTVRTRLLTLAESRGWNLAAYAAYTMPLVALHPVNPFHNLLSMGLLPNGKVALGIGVAPLPNIIVAPMD